MNPIIETILKNEDDHYDIAQIDVHEDGTFTVYVEEMLDEDVLGIQLYLGREKYETVFRDLEQRLRNRNKAV